MRPRTRHLACSEHTKDRVEIVVVLSRNSVPNRANFVDDWVSAHWSSSTRSSSGVQMTGGRNPAARHTASISRGPPRWRYGYSSRSPGSQRHALPRSPRVRPCGSWYYAERARQAGRGEPNPMRLHGVPCRPNVGAHQPRAARARLRDLALRRAFVGCRAVILIQPSPCSYSL